MAIHEGHRWTVASVVLFWAGAAAGAATLNVDAGGGADSADIQSAIDAAGEGDVVMVEAGTYPITEPITFKGKAITVASTGGAKEVVIRMSPSDEKRGSVVVFENGESEASVLRGFTLTGGTGTRWGAEFDLGGGGGILCLSGSSPTIEDCEIRENRAEKGGGMYCYGASPILRRCFFSANRAGTPGAEMNAYGAGIYCASGSPASFEDCEISGNLGPGAGLWLNASDAVLTRCAIADNEKGGVFCVLCAPVFRNCTISRNYSPEAVARGEEGGPGLSCNNRGNPSSSIPPSRRTGLRESWPSAGRIRNSRVAPSTEISGTAVSAGSPPR